RLLSRESHGTSLPPWPCKGVNLALRNRHFALFAGWKRSFGFAAGRGETQGGGEGEGRGRSFARNPLPRDAAGDAPHTTIFGNANSKRAPPVSGSFPALSVPPCATASERARESPMPNPSDP